MDDRYSKLMDERSKKLYREYDKHSDEGLNNIRKNMKADRDSWNNHFSKQLPVDEMATMGSDTQGIVRDHSKMSPELKKKWDDALSETALKERMAKTHLHERGYEEIRMKKTIKNPAGNKTKFVNKVLGKTLKGLAIVGALGASDMASAAADAVVPGGVEDMGVSDEQRDLDRRYHEIIKQRSKRK